MSGSMADHEELVRAWEKDQTYQAHPLGTGPSAIARMSVRTRLAKAALRCGWNGNDLEAWVAQRVKLFLHQRGPAHDAPEHAPQERLGVAGHPVFGHLGNIIGVWISPCSYAYRGVVEVAWSGEKPRLGEPVTWDERAHAFSQSSGQGTKFVLRSLGTTGKVWIDLGGF